MEDIANAKILIVDDNSSNILLLEKLLNISGYQNIQSTTDSRETINLYTSYQPDLLLLDLRMPYLDGFQVIEQLNQIKGNDYLPVIAITAQNDQEYRIKALQMGAKDFIGKPFDQSEILMRIKNILEMRLIHNESLMENRRLEDKVNESTRELHGANIELIHRLARAAEFRDGEMGSHISRISMYAYELGKVLDFDEEYCELLMHASTLHDIGKIGIPDEILLKAGRLNDAEWEKMKTHAAKGAQILSGSSSGLIMMAEEIALTHHEKWDGSGYPSGLRGEEIPITGRITAICDVFDALISERPYKKPWSVDDALAEIKRGSGSHFDPFLVKKFSQIIPTILRIKELYS